MFGPFSSIAQLGSALRKRQVSSLELTREYLHRLDTTGRAYNSVREITTERALAQAKAADKRLAEGGATHPLLGIPFGVKDLYATKGIPTRWGSPGHHDQVFDFDATAVRRLQDAGGVLLAKLSMVELAGGGNYMVADASDAGPGKCAWDPGRWAGGSSTGSGSATALGCVGYSLGSETSGSITCPSAFNGVTGFRPTYGRVSRHGAMPLCWTLDKLGPIARSAEDCATVLQAIAGPDPLDPSTLSDRLSLSTRGPRPKIGLLKEPFAVNDAKACEKAYGQAIAVLKGLGYEFVDVAYPELPYGLAVGLIVDAEGASAHEHFIRGPRLSMLADPHQVAGFAASLETKAVEYLWAMRFRTEALKANSVWDECDCIFTPVFLHAAVPLDVGFEKSFEKMGGDGGPANLLGWPAMAFPMGFEDGAPLGGSIIAPCFREDLCYRVARDFQRATDWHTLRPALRE